MAIERYRAAIFEDDGRDQVERDTGADVHLSPDRQLAARLVRAVELEPPVKVDLRADRRPEGLQIA